MNIYDIFSWWEYDLSENYSETEQLISVLLNYLVLCLLSEAKLWLSIRLKV